MNRLLTALIIGAAAVIPTCCRADVSAAVHADTDTPVWKAIWITDRVDQFPDSAITEPAPYFRKEFKLKKKPVKATLHISGLGFYEMEINGRRVGDQVLAPAVTNYDKRTLKNLLYHYDDQSRQRVFYNTFDVTPMLRKGKNAIGALLGNGWYNQRDRTVEGHMWYDIPKMIAQVELEFADGTRDTIATDTSWKTAHGPLVHDAIFTGEVYDNRLNLGKWTQPGYNDRKWARVIPARVPSGKLVPQTVPFNRQTADVPTEFEAVNDSTYRFTLPETVSGWCAITVNGNAGDIVKLRHISEGGSTTASSTPTSLAGKVSRHGNRASPGTPSAPLRSSHPRRRLTPGAFEYAPFTPMLRAQAHSSAPTHCSTGWQRLSTAPCTPTSRVS